MGFRLVSTKSLPELKPTQVSDVYMHHQTPKILLIFLWTKWPPFRCWHFQIHFQYKAISPVHFVNEWLISVPIKNIQELISCTCYWRKSSYSPSDDHLFLQTRQMCPALQPLVLKWTSCVQLGVQSPAKGDDYWRHCEPLGAMEITWIAFPLYHHKEYVRCKAQRA